MDDDIAPVKDEPRAGASVHSLCIKSLDQIRKAIRDPRLDRGHLKVLANLSKRFNTGTLTAWPSRERIAHDEVTSVKTVGNKLYDLRQLGYIDWDGLPDPKRPRRSLLHYWLREEAITEAVKGLREKIVVESARPARHQKCPSERAMLESARLGGFETARSGGLETARSGGNKELNEEGTQRGEARAQDAHARRPPSPRMNGVGFVISAEQNLIIPAETVECWRKRFPDLPDLEAAMQKLAANLLHRGSSHPGWTCPEGWMVGAPSEMNEEAANKRRVADAKVASALRGRPEQTVTWISLVNFGPC
jgi:hypothetical protein